MGIRGACSRRGFGAVDLILPRGRVDDHSRWGHSHNILISPLVLGEIEAIMRINEMLPLVVTQLSP